MMRKIIFFLTLMFLINLIFTTSVVSQSPTPIFRVNCGYADDSDANKCCQTSFFNLDETKKETKEKAPLAGQILDKLPNFNIEEKIPFLNQVVKKCYLGEPDESSGACICKQTVSPTPVKKLEEICNKFAKGNEQAHCISCAKGGGILTAIGCVPLNLGNFITDYLLGRLIGLAGIIALLCIIYSVFTLQTSQGNPEKIKKAQELLTSCIMGLMLIIFSVFILRLIGVDILRIPGFG